MCLKVPEPKTQQTIGGLGGSVGPPPSSLFSTESLSVVPSFPPRHHRPLTTSQNLEGADKTINREVLDVDTQRKYKEIDRSSE